MLKMGEIKLVLMLILCVCLELGAQNMTNEDYHLLGHCKQTHESSNDTKTDEYQRDNVKERRAVTTQLAILGKVKRSIVVSKTNITKSPDELPDVLPKRVITTSAKSQAAIEFTTPKMLNLDIPSLTLGNNKYQKGFQKVGLPIPNFKATENDIHINIPFLNLQLKGSRKLHKGIEKTVANTGVTQNELHKNETPTSNKTNNVKFVSNIANETTTEHERGEKTEIPEHTPKLEKDEIQSLKDVELDHKNKKDEIPATKPPDSHNNGDHVNSTAEVSLRITETEKTEECSKNEPNGSDPVENRKFLQDYDRNKNVSIAYVPTPYLIVIPQYIPVYCNCGVPMSCGNPNVYRSNQRNDNGGSQNANARMLIQKQNSARYMPVNNFVMNTRLYHTYLKRQDNHNNMCCTYECNRRNDENQNQNINNEMNACSTSYNTKRGLLNNNMLNRYYTCDIYRKTYENQNQDYLIKHNIQQLPERFREAERFEDISLSNRDDLLTDSIWRRYYDDSIYTPTINNCENIVQ